MSVVGTVNKLNKDTSSYYIFVYFSFLIFRLRTFNEILSSSIESSDSTFFVDSFFSGLFESSMLGLS